SSEPLVVVPELAQEGRFADVDGVPQKDPKRLAARMMASQPDRIGQALRLALPNEMDPYLSRELGEFLQSQTFAHAIEFGVVVEVILERPLASARNDQDVVGAGGGRFFHHILNDRPIDDRQHFFGLALRGRQESSTEAGRGDDDLHPRLPPLPAARTAASTRDSPESGPTPNARIRSPVASLVRSFTDRRRSTKHGSFIRRVHSGRHFRYSGQSACTTAASASASDSVTEPLNSTLPRLEEGQRSQARRKLDKATGSWTLTRTPSRTKPETKGRARDSLTSSVPALNASPSTATVLPSKGPATLRTSVMICFAWSSLMLSVASPVRSQTPSSRARRTKALRSFSKQLPPKPGPALRNRRPIRESAPTASITRSMSRPSSSDSRENSFANDTLSARNAFDEYFTSSAPEGVRRKLWARNGRYTLLSQPWERKSRVPNTIRSGWRASRTIVPSARNSGFTATPSSWGDFPDRRRSIGSTTVSVVPGKTVLLTTTSRYPSTLRSARPSSAVPFFNGRRSMPPPARLGVGRQRKMPSAAFASTGALS